MIVSLSTGNSHTTLNLVTYLTKILLSFMTIFLNSICDICPLLETTIKIPRAEKYQIVEVLINRAIGIGMSFLSTKPCPITAWIRVKVHGNNPLQAGIDNFSRTIYYPNSKCSPLTFTFLGIRKYKTNMKDILSYLPDFQMQWPSVITLMQ